MKHWFVEKYYASDQWKAFLAEAGCNVLELQSRSGHLMLTERQKYIDKEDKKFAANRAEEKGQGAYGQAEIRKENRGPIVYSSKRRVSNRP